jgi:citrate lyase subunit beta / citryl-CoA lyase
VSTATEATVWLFCPGDRPDRYQRALESADVIIIDLEDAVGAADKSMARDRLVDAASWLDPSRVIVRVNAAMTAEGGADIVALRGTHLRTVMLPKVSGPAQVEALDDFAVVALCESASGVLAAPRIAAAPNCVALTWGGQDLAVDLGASRIRDAQGMLPVATYARTAIRYAAAAAGIAAYDTVWIDIDDLDGLAAEAREAADQGFAGKMVIHPRHVGPVDDAFRPRPDEIAAAQRVMAAAEVASSGAVAAGGQMIDRPVIEQARRVLARSAREPRQGAAARPDGGRSPA